MKTNVIIEIYVWIAFAILVAGRPIYMYIYRGGPSYMMYLEYYVDILLGIIVVIFPFLFKLIFSEFPFQYIRNARIRRFLLSRPDVGGFVTRPWIKLPATGSESAYTPSSPVTASQRQERADAREEKLIAGYLEASKEIAQNLYTRSGAYLLIGCLIAFAGVLFFYFQTANLHVLDTENSKEVLNTSAGSNKPVQDVLNSIQITRIVFEYLPRVGTLIFVEAIAFFFLRQYRLMMEEYRYYEAIKRQRENQLAALYLFNGYKESPKLLENIIGFMKFGENPNRLSKEDTTNIIETEKLNSKDFDMAGKLLEFLKAYRK